MSEVKKEAFRAVFPPGQQKRFLENLGLGDSKIQHRVADELRLPQRTLRDWVEGKYRIPWHILESICQWLGVELPPEAQAVSNATLRRQAANRAGLVHIQRYGNPGTPDGRRKGGIIFQMRRRENPENYRHCNLRKVINRPTLSADLAEFVGIILGDGSISGHQVKVSLSSETDKEYGSFVARLAQQLFNVEAAIVRKNIAGALRL